MEDAWELVKEKCVGYVHGVFIEELFEMGSVECGFFFFSRVIRGLRR